MERVRQVRLGSLCTMYAFFSLNHSLFGGAGGENLKMG